PHVQLSGYEPSPPKSLATSIPGSMSRQTRSRPSFPTKYPSSKRHSAVLSTRVPARLLSMVVSLNYGISDLSKLICRSTAVAEFRADKNRGALHGQCRRKH